MKVRLLKPVVIAGHPGVQVGDVFEMAHPAEVLLGGYVVEVVGEASAAELLPPRSNPIETHEPVVENRDPEIRQQKQRRKSS